MIEYKFRKGITNEDGAEEKIRKAYDFVLKKFLEKYNIIDVEEIIHDKDLSGLTTSHNKSFMIS
ncbi:hypothetical protein [Fervidicola ferrireducens]|jgi:hypothetical protein|uniref:hypothetical protein n=1 Tax=Fervidicola ferrireducens TaxID=520764 RepID=UPI0008316F59|nr:hypothetical protein [Fervidicola ferrireducens]